MPFKVEPPLYSVWGSMRSRCNNPNNRQYKDYGGRGIRICERWDSFKAFETDMGPRPEGNYSLDRIDNDGNYTPENCRWASRTEQQRNQRVTRRVIIEGQSYLAVELADKSGLKTDTIIERARRGLTLAEVLDPAKRVFTDGLALGGKASGAVKQARTHCHQGHEFTAENTRITPQGWRVCRLCHAEKVRQQNARKRATAALAPSAPA